MSQHLINSTIEIYFVTISNCQSQTALLPGIDQTHMESAPGISTNWIVSNMLSDIEMTDFLDKEVVHMLTFLRDTNKVQIDYKILGNKSGTTIVLRFGQPPLAMHGSTPLPSFSTRKSPAAIQRDYNRSCSRYGNMKESTDYECNSQGPDISMPDSNAGSCGSVLLERHSECKQTMTGDISDNQLIQTSSLRNRDNEGLTTKPKDDPHDVDGHLKDSKQIVMCKEAHDHDQQSQGKEVQKDNDTSRNTSFHSIYLDTRRDERFFIAVSDDYVVKMDDRKYAGCAYDESSSEFQALLLLTKNWEPVNMKDYVYKKPLLFHMLKVAPSKVNKWVDLTPWV